MPKFSIIIPTLNEAKTIGGLLGDLKGQSYRDFEVIVADAQSEDETVVAARAFEPDLPKLTVVISPKRNVSFQRNHGAEQAEGEWLVFMDADNRIAPHFMLGIAYRVEMAKPEIMVTHLRPDSEDRKDLALTTLINTYIEVQKSTKNPYCLESMMVFERSVFDKIGGFNEEVPWGEGNHLLRQAAKKGIYLTIFKDPSYVYSLRRLRSQGKLKLARNVAQIELSRLIGREISRKKAVELYPMKGGNFFEAGQQEGSSLESILAEISRLPKLPRKYMRLLNDKAAPAGKVKRWMGKLGF